ncbi:MAG: glutamine-hydrolyzing carbamoyl-phosphate synthase small subunit [Elusimicrobia bacterium]|nr:glutamine-hydrolyzing carbamoyl-phosphate synthase small subunit [Elusimicrobiota bacterium]MBD3411866.1 glutamine-hydrolyzing carbamoyl-phosphate synthase small subunit [Elusimicrobiota bacterium]
MKAYLALESGRIFEGESFGVAGEALGEVVFNTGMCGYQEILTDPSYYGQIITMTYPHIGNYGTNADDCESDRSYVKGFVVREKSSIASNWRSERALDSFLKKNRIIAIDGVDTRALTLHIREAGAMRACLSTVTKNKKNLVHKARTSPSMVGADLVKKVIPKEIKKFAGKRKLSHKQCHVVLIDYGSKSNIMRSLCARDCAVTVVPGNATAEEIRSKNPDGIMLSNGPGDPAAVTYAIATLTELIRTFHKPIFGICLGHQLLALALGGKTFKLPFGHRGVNQPVKNVATGKVEITSQNHGFNVAMDSLKNSDVEISHINLNDQTVEGIRHARYPYFSVQYHPEACPGPHDSVYLFDQFIDCMKQHQT